MNKLIGLDKLIAEVLGINERAPAKGSVSGVKAPGKSTENTGLDLQEILTILQVGSETAGVIESSKTAWTSILGTPHIQPADLTSAQGIVDFFKQFDVVGQLLETQKCSSLSSLVSKYAVAASLVSIFNQFNQQAGGYVAEGFVAQLLQGKTVPVGGGGIEDIRVGDIGINTKVKETKHIGGSKTQLLETLNIPYYAAWKEDSYLLGGTRIPLTPYGTAYNPITGDVVAKPGESVTGQSVLVKSNSPITSLYYVFFHKEGSGETDKKGNVDSRGLKIVAKKIDKATVQAASKQLKPHQKHERAKGVWMLNSIVSPLGSLSTLEDGGAVHEFTTKFDVTNMNDVLKDDASEVFESLSRLDAWFGGLKEHLIGYVSTLEKKELGELQKHLHQGQAWQFEAFNKKCN